MVKTFQTWEHLLAFLEKTYGIEPELVTVLFLIGIQESGGGFKNYTRDEKTELMKLAQFVLLSREKLYIKISNGPENSVVWAKNPERPLPAGNVLDRLLKSLVLDYFNEKQFLN